MLNQTVIVGRLVSKPETKELEEGKKVANLTLAIPRSYKNENGEYDTDFIDCTLWNGIAESTAEYCNKGDLIGVKGRLESKEREIEGKKIKVTNLIAEKVTFLTSKQKETENSNEMEV